MECRVLIGLDTNLAGSFLEHFLSFSGQFVLMSVITTYQVKHTLCDTLSEWEGACLMSPVHYSLTLSYIYTHTLPQIYAMS